MSIVQSEKTQPPGSQAWSRIPWLGLLAGIGLLGQLYMQASQTDVPLLFERFWLGMFLFYAPAFWRLLSSQPSRSERITLLVGIALFSYVPKLFRCPYYFCYSDELTWWRGVQNLLMGSPVVSDNILGLIQGNFPGLPLLTIVLQKAGGLSTFEAGLLIMGLMRVLTILTIFLLGEKIFQSSKVGAAAALVYGANANFLFFSSQFSYESLAFPLVLVILLFLQYLVNGDAERSGNAWRLVILACIAAIVITHHLATYMLIAILILMVVAARLLPRFIQPKALRQLVGITSFAIVAGIGWLWISNTDVVEYLGDPITRGIEQVASLKIRRLFSGITLPWYEIGSGYAAAILVGLLAMLGAYLIIRHKQRLNSAQMGLLSFGSLYILTSPMVLTTWGAESGRRSWVYSFIGISLLAGFALDWITSSDFIRFRQNRRLGQFSATLALCILLLGGIASSTSISYRFPGAYLQNSDARSYTPEIIDAAQWLFNQVGPDQRVLGDRTTERIFGSYGLQEPAMYGGPRPWEVYFPVSWTPQALDWLEDANAPFVVVDERMAELPPQMDFRFQRNEPTNAFSSQPIPVQAVQKFDQLPGLDRIYDSGNIHIYFINRSGQTVFKAGTTRVTSVLQNPAETIEASGNGFQILFTSLATFLRCLFLIVFVLYLPGELLGKRLFPDWSEMETGTRVIVATSISISTIILLAFILAYLLASAGKAAIIVLFLIGFLVITGLIQLQERLSRSRSSMDELVSKRKEFTQIFRQPGAAPVYALGFLSVLLVMFMMGAIRPRYEPRTDLSLDYSSMPPSVRITNLEHGAKTYQLVIQAEGGTTRISRDVQLNENQSIDISLQEASPRLPAQGKISLDLYMEGEPNPYRSVHFVQGEGPIGSAIPEEAPQE